jgi:hypothetical protein
MLKDQRDLLLAFNAHHVRYLVIGRSRDLADVEDLRAAAAATAKPTEPQAE